MNRELPDVLQQLIHSRIIAALGTLHQGVPFVSMVPYAVAKDGSFILHVSRLAAHTRDMLDNPEVSLLITESEGWGKMPQALARVTVQGRAEMLDRDSEKNTDAREVYLSRFPDAAPLFEFSDFNIFIIKPISARVIAGFGQAATITGEDFAAALCAANQ
ncbi:MAG TPA: pyridoxamine 5'-phosphate oxidase family protein [Candidatus Bathyarchaeia archaeon]|nr:pyridoxamine 5'-phosphate oxidase family protein [Candidatus Bathyarchaeia archaeon]